MKLGTAHDACEIMGPVRAPDVERARSLVRNFTAGGSSELREAVVSHIASTGDCVLHAVAAVRGTPCACSPCTNPADSRHSWSVDSLRLAHSETHRNASVDKLN